MSPEKQRIAIAEACGIKWKIEPIYPEDLDGPRWHRISFPNGNDCCQYLLEEGLPDYLNDLNAMNEAEKTLTWDQQKTFISHLIGLEGRDGDALWTLAWDSAWLCSSATADQRAEAFLRTIGKWEE